MNAEKSSQIKSAYMASGSGDHAEDGELEKLVLKINHVILYVIYALFKGEVQITVYWLCHTRKSK